MSLWTPVRGGGGTTEVVTEDFEDISAVTDRYTGDTASYSLDTTTVYEGSQSLHTSAGSYDVINEDGTLDSPSAGDRVHYRTYQTTGAAMMPMIGCSSNDSNSYYIDYSENDTRFRWGYWDAGTATTVDSDLNAGSHTGDWLEVVIDWRDVNGDGSKVEIEAWLYDSAGNQLSNIIGSETTVTYLDGNIAWGTYGTGGASGYVDYMWYEEDVARPDLKREGEIINGVDVQLPARVARDGVGDGGQFFDGFPAVLRGVGNVGRHPEVVDGVDVDLRRFPRTDIPNDMANVPVIVVIGDRPVTQDPSCEVSRIKGEVCGAGCRPRRFDGFDNTRP